VNREVINEFDPVSFSEAENLWLLENIDKPPVVALAGIKAVRVPPAGRNKNGVIYPDGVNPNAVGPLMRRVQELDDLSKHEGQGWVGREAIREAIRTYLAVDAKWAADARRSSKAPRFPSLYSFDSKGRPHIGGPGSDSGQVRTYFDEAGNRKPFAISLLAVDDSWAGPGFTEVPEKGLMVNAEATRIECFCGHTERYKADSRASYNAARARISKHLRKATDNVEQHRELHANEFG
jgi:hypothetical protein